MLDCNEPDAFRSYERFLTQVQDQSRQTRKAKKSSSSKGVKYVYFFGNGKADGNGKMKSLLGGKGANLAEMTKIRLPVPAGFTITTEVCTYYYDHNRTYPASLDRLS